jgi:hypothetical protein
VLGSPDGLLVRAEERVPDAMLSGWHSDAVRELAVNTIKARCHVIRRFVEFTTDYRSRWRQADVDEFRAERRSRAKPITLSTLRQQHDDQIGARRMRWRPIFDCPLPGMKEPPVCHKPETGCFL